MSHLQAIYVSWMTVLEKRGNPKSTYVPPSTVIADHMNRKRHWEIEAASGISLHQSRNYILSQR